MRHLFTDHYLNDLEEQLVRCSKCGVASHWTAARDACAGSYYTLPEVSEANRSHAAKRRERDRKREAKKRAFAALHAAREANERRAAANVARLEAARRHFDAAQKQD